MRKTILWAILLLPVFSFAEIYDNIVIRVNNKIVNRYELDKFKAFLKATSGMTQHTDQQIAQQLANILVLEYFTEENSIEISEKDVIRELNDIAEKMKLSGEQQIRTELSKQFNMPVSQDDLRDFIKKQLVFKKSQEFLILNKKRNELKQPTEQEILDVYNKNKHYFVAPAEIKIAHLVILITKDMGFKEQVALEKKLLAARSECLKVKDLAKREELFYQKVEKEASTIYQKNRGLLGSFDSEKLRSLFPQYLKAFDLKKGEITDIIATDYGRHIVIVLDKKGGEALQIDKVRPAIEQNIMMQQGLKIFNTWLEEYSKKYKIFIKL